MPGKCVLHENSVCHGGLQDLTQLSWRTPWGRGGWRRRKETTIPYPKAGQPEAGQALEKDPEPCVWGGGPHTESAGRCILLPSPGSGRCMSPMTRGNKQHLGSHLPAQITTYGRQSLPLEAGSEDPRAHSCLGADFTIPSKAWALTMTPYWRD